MIVSVCRVERPGFHDLINFYDRRFRRSCHDGVEVTRRLAIDQIPEPIRAMRLDERIVRAQRLLKDIAPPVNDAFLFAAGDVRSNAYRGIKRRNSRAECAHTFAENSLWDQLEFNFAAVELFVEIFRTGPWKSCDDPAYLTMLEQKPQFAIARAAIIADHFQIAGALPRQALNKIVGESGAAKPAEHDRSAVGNVRNGSVNRGEELIFLTHFSRRARDPGWCRTLARVDSM